MEKKTLKPIKSYYLKVDSQGNYIPILDRDPVIAAKSIPLKDIKKCYKLLKETFEGIRTGDIHYEPLTETILFSGENFAWFSSMFKTFEEILRLRDSYEIPYDKAPVYEGIKAPVVYQPFHAARGSDANRRLYVYRSLSKTLHPINNYRIRLLAENHDMSEFVDDAYPSWYLLKSTTIFEQYSEKTNTRVRVDFYNGEFYYFVAGASDNWKEIKGVPLEMDHVIAALIFRSYNKF